MGEQMLTPEERASRRVKEYSGLMWHIATFVIINSFLWMIDLLSGGPEWAFWVTMSWGIGLAFHIAAYTIDSKGRGKRYERFLEDERKVTPSQ